MGQAEDIANEFKRKIGAIKETAIRRAVLARELADLDAELIAKVVGVMIERAAAGYPAYKDMLHNLGDFSELIRRAGENKMEAVLEFCLLEEMDDLANMLRRIPPRRLAEDHPEDVYIDRELSEQTLGMRKTLGRIGDRDLVNRLLHDQDPKVVEQILTNPTLTEDQVVKIAAKRPTSSEVLRIISRSQRWIRSYRVRKSLVFNPYTPTEISINLLQLLMTQDVFEISNDGSLHSDLRMAAKRLKTEREVK